jgi:large subunit ribosomal protein L18
MADKSRSQARIRRHERVRKSVQGSAQRPRLSVFRSLTEIYAQVIDDQVGHTIASASSIDEELRSKMKGRRNQSRPNWSAKPLHNAPRAMVHKTRCF